MINFKNKNYYLSSFVWSTLSKLLNAVLGFISIPILLNAYGMSDYGVLSIAIACNAYMYVLDLGMNVGAIKFYSTWKTEGDLERIERVARTNITFYLIISLVNIILLGGFIIWGVGSFSLSGYQSSMLVTCLLILAGFSVMNWLSSVFYQLLVANEQMGYAMQVQCVQTIFKLLFVGSLCWVEIQLTSYFLIFTFIVSLVVVPYAMRCKRTQLIRSLKPAFYFPELKEVLAFSLSIFLLSLLQISAVQSRPLLLGIFAFDGASSVAEYKIIELIPNFLIVLCGVFSSIFLPRTSAMMVNKSQTEIQTFSNTWTLRVSILANLLSVPFALCASDVLYVYLGKGYEDLAFWMALWIPAIVLQIHSTPGNAIVLAHGNIRPLVVITFIACMISIPINIVLIKPLGVGAAVVSYYIYIFIILLYNYIYYYKKVLHLQSWTMFKRFVQPTAVAILTSVVSFELFTAIAPIFSGISRLECLGLLTLKIIIWCSFYLLCLKTVGIDGVSLKKIFLLDTK